VILLKNLNLTPFEIKKAILKLDEFSLTRNVLEQLVKYVPTDEEVSEFQPSGHFTFAALPSTLFAHILPSLDQAYYGTQTRTEQAWAQREIFL